MNREEARADLMLAQADISYRPKDDSIDMAIEALKQEPFDDVISRQAVLAIAGDSCLDLDNYEDTKEFCDAINDLPPVTPQSKTGHWIDNKVQTKLCNCSECNALSKVYFKYCPNCGAKMEGE